MLTPGVLIKISGCLQSQLSNLANFPKVSKRRFDHSFMFCGPTWWNKLPLEIRTASTFGVFRRKLKTYLFDLAYPP
jgi:hypothetical protein